MVVQDLRDRARRTLESRLKTSLRKELRARRIDAAIEHAEKLINLEPCAETIETLICPVDSVATDFDKNTQYDLLRILEQKTNHQDEIWNIHFKTVLLERLGWPEEALKESKHLRDAPPRYGWMRHNRGLMLSNLRWDFVGAREEFEAVLKSAPQFWKARACIAESLLCQGKSDEALAEMERCVSRLGGNEKDQALAWRGELKLWTGRYADAVKDLDDQARRKIPLALCWRGGALRQMGRFAEALRDLDESLAIFSRDPEALVWRAETLRHLGRPNDARRDLDQAVTISGQPIWAMMNRALISLEEGDARGFWSDFDLLPHRVISFFEWQEGVTVGRHAERGKRLLESILSSAKGLRRNELYLYPVWMNRKLVPRP